MKKIFDEAVAKLNFSTLNLDPSTSFTYSVIRYDDNQKAIIIGSVNWPK